MGKSRKEERQHSPADICRLFNLNRTTLFRWEDEGKIPPAERDLKDQRIYERIHLQSLAKIQRGKIRRDIENVFKHDPDNKALFWDTLERLYRVEVVCDAEPLHAVQKLSSLVKFRPLLEETVDFLVGAAQLQPAGDGLRQGIWLLLAEHEQAVKSQGNKKQKINA